MYARKRGAECTPSWNSARASICGPGRGSRGHEDVKQHHVVKLGVQCRTAPESYEDPVADDAPAGPVERTRDGVVAHPLQRRDEPRPVAAALPSVGEAKVPKLANGGGQGPPVRGGRAIEGEHHTGGHEDPEIERGSPPLGHDRPPSKISQLKDRDPRSLRLTEQRQLLCEARQVVAALDQATERQLRCLPRRVLLNHDSGEDRVRTLHRPDLFRRLRPVLGRFHPTRTPRGSLRRALRGSLGLHFGLCGPLGLVFGHFGRHPGKHRVQPGVSRAVLGLLFGHQRLLNGGSFGHRGGETWES